MLGHCFAQTVCVTGSTTTGEKLTEANMREAFAASDEILGLDAVGQEPSYTYSHIGWAGNEGRGIQQHLGYSFPHPRCCLNKNVLSTYPCEVCVCVNIKCCMP